MKVKLKVYRGQVDAAKTAWSTARKSKKSAEEIKAARDEYEAKLAVLDDALDAGATDDTEIEIKEADPAPANDDGNVIEFKQLEGMLRKSIEEQLKALLPANLAAGIKKEDLDQAIADAFKKHTQAGAQSVTTEQVKSIVGDIIKDQVSKATRPSRQQHDTDPAQHDGRATDRSQIEMPVSWSKGNLPLHGKQLLNCILMSQSGSKIRHMNEGIEDADLVKGARLGENQIARYKAAIKGVFAGNGKALTSTTAGSGDEFVPTDLSSELQRRLYLASDLGALIAGREVDMPTQPYQYPLSTTRPTFYLESSERTETTESSPGTSNLTLDAKKLMGETAVSYEVDEDSIVPILPFVQEQLGEAAAAAYESIIINGDTTATHQDSDTQLVAKAAERAWNGFRKLSLAVSALKSDLSTGGINEANLRALKKLMGKFGVRVRDLVWIVGPKGVNDMAAISNVATLEKYGPRATILTGELSSFLGIPIITSEQQRENLNASGVYDGTTTTKGAIILANLTRFIPGRRREFTVESFRDVKKQETTIVASFRRAFQPIEAPSATNQSVVIGYNYNS